MIATAVDEIDRASAQAFRDLVGPLFERAPRFLDRLEAARPFGSSDALFERALEIALAMPEDEQIELLNAHPRLGASPMSVSALSFVEQGYDRQAADERAADERAEADRAALDAELGRLNDTYEARFGFRYCVFVAGRSRAELVPEMRAALEADRARELRRALTAVVDIARDRFRKATDGGRTGERT